LPSVLIRGGQRQIHQRLDALAHVYEAAEVQARSSYTLPQTAVHPVEHGREAAGARADVDSVVMWPLLFLVLGGVLIAEVAHADPVKVRLPEGHARGFLVLSAKAGEAIAHGELVQTPRRGLVDSRITFHFKDGSLYDETVVFSQKDVFALVSYRLLQQGPSFPGVADVSFERVSGRYKARIKEKDDDEQTLEGRLDLPPDLYNGMTSLLLRNLAPGQVVRGHSLAFTPKPRILKMELKPEGTETILVGTLSRPATRYLVDLEIGGMMGVLASVVGKEPPDLRLWIADGPARAFVKFEGPFYLGGPVWRIELSAPRWPK
jgi:hypothetical protein